MRPISLVRRGMVATRQLSTSGLLTTQRNKLLIIELNRPKALNALNLEMCQEMNELLRHKINGTDGGVAAFLVKGVGGKAFCAGGDVKTVWQELTAGKLPEGDVGSGKPGLVHSDFFRAEYTMNYLLGVSLVPQISVWDGIVMGGGVGISVLGEYRIATENTLFAMPETAIGLFPDVGSSAWLPDLANGFGPYLGLSGSRLRAEDLLHTGIATHFVSSAKLPQLEEALSGDLPLDPAESRQQISKILKEFQLESDKPDPSTSFLAEKAKLIDRCFNVTTVEEIFDRLQREADGQIKTEDGSEIETTEENKLWAGKTLQSLKRMSPTSLKITLKQLQSSKDLDLKRCLHMEFRMMMRCMSGNDFREGIRSVLVDKDNNPQWNPATLQEVSDEMVEGYFSKLGEHELYL